nr:putative integron gene cassette protein [uncultured bacterium]
MIKIIIILSSIVFSAMMYCLCWKCIGHLKTPFARLALHTLLLAILIAPVPVVGFGIGILPSIIVLVIFGTNFPSSLDFATIIHLIWLVSSIIFTWWAFIGIRVLFSSSGKYFIRESYNNKRHNGA